MGVAALKAENQRQNDKRRTHHEETSTYPFTSIGHVPVPVHTGDAEEVTPERAIVYTTTAEERDAIFEAEVEKKLSQLFPMVLQEKLGINIRVRI